MPMAPLFRRAAVSLFAATCAAPACTLLVDTRGLMQNTPDAALADAGAESSAADAAADGPPFTPETRCPNKGGTMVNVGTHCIDVTEVSIASYDQFVASGPVAIEEQPAACAFNDDLRRGEQVAADPLTQPVVDVDWCDAFAFCRWAGKRLCGRIGGGATTFARFADAAESQWQRACSSDGANDWVYGDAYQPATCRGDDYPDQSDYPVASLTAQDCRSPTPPFSAVYDACGNASEWEDSCDNASGGLDRCRVRGGSREDDAAGTRCDADATRLRNHRSPFIGIRCCFP